MTVQYRPAKSTVTVLYRHTKSTVTVPYRQTRNTVTALYHHTRTTMMVLYEQVQEQGEKTCVKAIQNVVIHQMIDKLPNKSS